MKARSWLTNADPVQRRQVMELLELKVSIIDRAHYEITGSVPLDDLVAVKTASPGRNFTHSDDVANLATLSDERAVPKRESDLVST